MLRSKKKKEKERVKLLNDIKAYESTLSYLNNELDIIEDEVKDDCRAEKVALGRAYPRRKGPDKRQNQRRE